MARSGRNVGELFELMVRTGLGVRSAARHLKIPYGTATAAKQREERQVAGQGRLAGYVKRDKATCGRDGCTLCGRPAAE